MPKDYETKYENFNLNKNNDKIIFEILQYVLTEMKVATRILGSGKTKRNAFEIANSKSEKNEAFLSLCKF